MQQLALEEVARGGQVRIYLHRQMLREQLSRVFDEAGIDHGVQASGHELQADKPIQICMTDSVYSRAIVKAKWDLGKPTLVMFDEAHQQTGNKAISLVKGGTNANGFSWKGHIEQGAFVLGMSATPVNCGEMYEKLIDFGTYSEMRKVGAHLPVRVYSPSEVDCAGLSTNAENEYNSKLLEPRAYKIFGDAYLWWRKLNPDSLPALLFAPSVDASKWFAEEWAKMGVPVAHIDGSVCLLPTMRSDGSIHLEQYDSNEEIRNEILRMSKSGEIKLVCNRFVLREAIDMPWIKHGIAATVFGGIATYLQSVGRIQRFCEGYDYKIWQCHGGSYWRHGSPNMNRDWKLGDTSKSIAKGRANQIQRSESPQDVEGICCPKCNVWRQHGVRCPGCGHTHKQSVRAVQMISGELKLMRGLVNKVKKKKSQTPQKIWDSVLWGSGKTGRSVSSAVSLWQARCAKAGVFAPSNTLKNPPPAKDSLDWHRTVSSVYPWVGKK
jgi:superfamily II DNA or RNA helicase